MDWNARDIHGFWCREGTTYNAYLIMAEKITLIDTVKKDFYDELMSRIASVVDPSRIDIVVSLHAEMDHSGCLPQVMHAVKPSKTYASTVGKETLSSQFYDPIMESIIPMEDGSFLDLGNMQLQFLHTAMMHWPDSMMALLEEDELLFSQDGFGLHLATSQRFDDELDLATLERYTSAYYANILLPFAPVVTKGVTKLKPILAGAKLIAPSHGPCWRTHRDWIVNKYLEWSAQRPTLKAVIVYDTMWGSVDKMARAFADGLAQEGVAVKLMRAKDCLRSDIVAEVLTSGGLVVGSSTLNRGMLPTVADNLHYMKGLRPLNLIGATFGSFGWGGGATKQVEKLLKEMGIPVVVSTSSVNYVPDSQTLEQSHAAGREFAAALRRHCGLPESKL